MQKISKRTFVGGVAAAALVGTGGGMLATAQGGSAASSAGPAAAFGGGPGGPHFGLGHGHAAVAAYLGLSADELRTQLEAGKSLADVAKAQGKSVDGLKAAIVAAAKKDLDQAVADGKLSADRAKQMLDRITASVDEMVNRTGPPDGGRGGRHFGLGHDQASVAAYLGLSTDQLRTQLQAGKSLADVAKAQGKSVDGLKAAILAEAKKDLDQAVADGKLTAARAEQMLDRITANVDEMVNRTGPPDRGPRFGRGFDGHPAPLGSAAYSAGGPFLANSRQQIRASRRGGRLQPTSALESRSGRRNGAGGREPPKGR